MSKITIAVGDVHGELGLFRLLVEEMRKRHVSFKLVTLGDYIDRGPDSAGVVSYLLELSRDPQIELVPLMGNHEQMMLQAVVVGNQSWLSDWLLNGGEETLLSYGYEGGSSLPRIPESHLKFLQSLSLYHDDGERLFVHAGVNPYVLEMEDQDEEDLLWIRNPFLTVRHELARLVVHGHTIRSGAPEVYDWRINLDSGAFRTGRLTAAVFDDESNETRFFQTRDQWGVEEIRR